MSIEGKGKIDSIENIERIDRKNRGSVTIEAALVLPVVMGIFLFAFTLMQMTFYHTKIQNQLNLISEQLAYESYALHELNIIPEMQRIYNQNASEAVTPQQLVQFVEEAQSILGQSNDLKMEGINTVDSLMHNPIDYLNYLVLQLERISNTSDIAAQLTSTIKTEGIYYMGSLFGRGYFQQRLQSYCEEQKLDVEITIEHCELFLEDDTGRVKINYQYRLPIGLGDFKTVTMSNAAYIHLYGGSGNYLEDGKDYLAESMYGEEEEGEGEKVDQDGYLTQVYITDFGEKYHANPFCFHIKVDAYTTVLGAIPKKNPCIYCAKNIDLDSSSIVYTTKSGDVYHSQRYCHAIYHTIKTVSEKEAVAKGYTPCRTCLSER